MKHRQGTNRGRSTNRGSYSGQAANRQLSAASQPSSNKRQTFDIRQKGRERLHNDYNQHFVDTGERPQNFVRDAIESKRFEEYPRLERLMQLKKEINVKRATPAQCIKADLRTFDFSTLESLFDVILIDPPWHEYYSRVGGISHYSENLNPWHLEDLKKLRVDCISDSPSFCFLWCGITHLEDARILLNTWGFRRCEDICWLKTNHKRKSTQESSVIHNEHSYLQRTTEHCLMGIKGTVKRSDENPFIHSNLDTDVILDEEPLETGSTAKPLEFYDIIERFCLGRRRIELFGTDRNIRDGWLTIGSTISTTRFDRRIYNSWFEGDVAWPEVQDYVGGKMTGTSQEIDQLRPKSPVRNASHKSEESGS